ncbi:CGH_3_collapsed_G0015150.mRNA.1.CDS.1 [Saccharomyces cerevisiae]|nr:CGH_3_collapsed_G0015150.mRNA.1.CDS.1 [Saccharomyces cerevisiae]
MAVKVILSSQQRKLKRQRTYEPKLLKRKKLAPYYKCIQVCEEYLVNKGQSDYGKRCSIWVSRRYSLNESIKFEQELYNELCQKK